MVGGPNGIFTVLARWPVVVEHNQDLVLVPNQCLLMAEPTAKDQQQKQCPATNIPAQVKETEY